MGVNVGDTVLFETADGQRTLLTVSSEPQLKDDGTWTFDARPYVEPKPKCSICGYVTWPLFPVAIEVNYGEEFGARDEYEFCDPCLIGKADALVAAGSRAELVTGSGEDDDEQADG